MEHTEHMEHGVFSMGLLSDITKSENAKTEIQKTEIPSGPCPSCGYPAYWQDRYSGPAGPWRCLHCSPPPVEAMVARWLGGSVVQCGPDGPDASGGELDAFREAWAIVADDESGRVVGTKRGATERQRIGEPLPPV